MNPLNRLALFASQILFSVITPPLLVPRIAELRPTRLFIAFCFGRSYGNRYQNIIDSFQGRYGLAMAEGLKKARARAGHGISIVADCGTGTGFVTKQAAEHFPEATFIAFDLFPGMLRQAGARCSSIATDVFHVQADTFSLPLADGSVDLVLAQNTMPCFWEFARVCRPGGVVVYVDSSAGWAAGRVTRLVEKQKLFEKVVGERVDMGFCVMAEKSGEAGPMPVEGKTKNERMINLLRCPYDKSRVVFDGRYICCEHQHRFSINDGFPVMIKK